MYPQPFVSWRHTGHRPRPLPYTAYPFAADRDAHWLQRLPPALPLVDFERAQPHRSRRYRATPTAQLAPPQQLELADVIAQSFARREPQCRHVQPPAAPPAGLLELWHHDPFGSSRFGPWTMERVIAWFVRLLILTDPASPHGAIRLNPAALEASLAIVDQHGTVLGGALNEPLPSMDELPALRTGDPFLAAALGVLEPILALLSAQDAAAIAALRTAYPAFARAYAAGRVGHLFMVARSERLAKADTFELVAASAERFQALGYDYMVVEATNQWTGAAFEVLGGVRVHYAPFQREALLPRSAGPLLDQVSSPTGFIADKDSGSMFYVLRLR